MYCPNCGKEIEFEWLLCPYCEYEPKKCKNPKHQPRWLSKEVNFCSECGDRLKEPIRETSMSGFDNMMKVAYEKAKREILEGKKIE